MTKIAQKGGEEIVARYQTNLARLLDEKLDLPKFTKIDFELLGDEMLLSGKVVKEWYEAAVGSDRFIGDHRRSTAEKIMAYLGIDDINELVIKVDSPHLIQEKASAAPIAAI